MLEVSVKLSWVDIGLNDPSFGGQFWGIMLALDWLKNQLCQANPDSENAVVPSGYTNYSEQFV